MKTQVRLFLILLLLVVLHGIFYYYPLLSQGSLQYFPGTVNRDCAPWDGTAFTISIPYDSVSVISISIWRSPDIQFPTTFSLPGDVGQVGYASLLWEVDPLIPLHGEVWFQSVGEGKPVEGRFSLTSDRGEKFQGKFIAQWEGQGMFCG